MRRAGRCPGPPRAVRRRRLDDHDLGSGGMLRDGARLGRPPRCPRGRPAHATRGLSDGPTWPSSAATTALVVGTSSRAADLGTRRSGRHRSRARWIVRHGAGASRAVGRSLLGEHWLPRSTVRAGRSGRRGDARSTRLQPGSACASVTSRRGGGDEAAARPDRQAVAMPDGPDGPATFTRRRPGSRGSDERRRGAVPAAPERRSRRSRAGDSAGSTGSRAVGHGCPIGNSTVSVRSSCRHP